MLMAGGGLRLAQQQRLARRRHRVARRTRARQSAVDTLLALATDVLKEGGHAPVADSGTACSDRSDALAAYGTGSWRRGTAAHRGRAGARLRRVRGLAAVGTGRRARPRQ